MEGSQVMDEVVDAPAMVAAPNSMGITPGGAKPAHPLRILHNNNYATLYIEDRGFGNASLVRA
jgi:hypothetical protein